MRVGIDDDGRVRSATELRVLIGSGEVSPVELLEWSLERIEEIDPALGAMVTVDRDGGRRAARAAERAVREGAELGPLHGLPIGVKDLQATAGIRTTFGSPLYATHVPDRDESSVARLRRAGGILIGKTNTSEFGAGANTVNALHGATGNPYAPGLTAGGSSGGSAVAVATGMVAAATGTDNGGSLRVPAAMCGVVGFRPSPGLVPSDANPFGWSALAVTGPIARTVADVRLLLTAQAASDPADPMSAPGLVDALAASAPIELASLRVAWTEDLGFAAIDPAVRDAFRARMASLEPRVASCACATVDLGDHHRVYETLRAEGFLTPAHRERWHEHRTELGPLVRANIASALEVTLTEVVAARVAQTEAVRRAAAFFADHDVWLTPTTSVPAFPWSQWHPTQIDQRAMRTYVEWLAPTSAVSLLGLPAVSLPWGTGPDGLPFGVQIVGAPRADAQVLEVAAALEAHLAAHPDARALGVGAAPDVDALRGRTRVTPDPSMFRTADAAGDTRPDDRGAGSTPVTR